MRKSTVMKELTHKAEELNNDIFQHYSFWVNGSDELDTYVRLLGLAQRANQVMTIAGNLRLLKIGPFDKHPTWQMLDRMTERVNLELNALDALKREQKLQIKDMLRFDDTDKILKVVRDMGLRIIRADDKEAVREAANAFGLIGPCYGPPGDGGFLPSWKGYRVLLTKYPSDHKISIIKEIRALTGMGLKEAKDASEALPYEITKTESADKAANWAHRLRDAGGSVEVQEYDV